MFHFAPKNRKTVQFQIKNRFCKFPGIESQSTLISWFICLRLVTPLKFTEKMFINCIYEIKQKSLIYLNFLLLLFPLSGESMSTRETRESNRLKKRIVCLVFRCRHSVTHWTKCGASSGFSIESILFAVLQKAENSCLPLCVGVCVCVCRTNEEDAFDVAAHSAFDGVR